MPTKDQPQPRRHADPDPAHPVEYGGDMEQDDADVPHEGGHKGGREPDPGERGPRRTPRQ